MDSETLITRLQSGDTDALCEVMDACTPYLCTVARNMAPVLPAQDIEEIVADAYVRLWCHRQTLDPARSLKGYLLRIVKNLVIDCLRRQKHVDLALIEEITDSGGEPETICERADTLERLRAHLDTLSDENRDILMRFYAYHQRTGDIARAYGIEPGALRTRMSRLRAELKRKLESEPFS